MSTSNPTLVYAGIFNQNSFGCDYTQFTNKGELITGLKVNWKGNYITAIDLAFNCTPVSTTKGSQVEGSQEDIFNLDLGDVIVEVFGRYSNYIDCFGIRTKNGKTKVWGNPITGNPFSFHQNEHYIKAMRLRASEYIEYVEPIYSHLLFKDAKPWPVAHQGKFTENIKNAVNGDQSYNDFDWIKNKFNYYVSKVVIMHNHNELTGIQFTYGMDGTHKSPGSHICEFDPMTTVQETLTIPEGDFLTTVLVKHTNYINYIYLQTFKGKTLSVGNQNVKGEEHYFIVPHNHQIIATSGDFQDGIRNLRIHFDQL